MYVGPTAYTLTAMLEKHVIRQLRVREGSPRPPPASLEIQCYVCIPYRGWSRDIKDGWPGTAALLLKISSWKTRQVTRCSLSSSQNAVPNQQLHQ